MSKKVVAKAYEAYGGPEFAYMAADGQEAGPTDEGEFRVASCGRHSSKRYPTWSKIAWGSPLKEEKGEIWVLHEGAWRPLSKVVALTKYDVENYHERLYRVRKVPTTWVFNDFGHVTCFLYKDLNHNGKRDTSEQIHPEFLHTTPENEAQTALMRPVVLGESHGCVHLRPVDLDQMIKLGYLRRNAKVVVHRYADRKVIFPKSGSGTPPYELHFFPSLKQLVVLANAW